MHQNRALGGPRDYIEVADLASDFRILAAEDHGDYQLFLRRAMQALASSHAHTPNPVANFEMVSNGEELVAAVRHAPDGFDLLLVDEMMPRLDGDEALREIYTGIDGVRGRIKALLYSNGATPEQLKRMIKLLEDEPDVLGVWQKEGRVDRRLLPTIVDVMSPDSDRQRIARHNIDLQTIAYFKTFGMENLLPERYRAIIENPGR